MSLAHWLTLGIAIAALVRIWWERRAANIEASRKRRRLYCGHL